MKQLILSFLKLITSGSKFILFAAECGMPRRPRFAFLVVGALTFALIFAALQERVFLIDGFRFGGYMTLLTQIAFFVAATIERYVTGDLQRRAPWKLYVVLSIFTAGGMCVCGVAPSVWIATKLRCTVPSFSLVAVPSAAAAPPRSTKSCAHTHSPSLLLLATPPHIPACAGSLRTGRSRSSTTRRA